MTYIDTVVPPTDNLYTFCWGLHGIGVVVTQELPTLLTGVRFVYSVLDSVAVAAYCHKCALTRGHRGQHVHAWIISLVV
jgi:hypothetical protein